MTSDRESETVNRGGASKPGREEHGGEFAGMTGKVKEKGEDTSFGDLDRGGTSSAGDCAAIDFDTAHDRAS